MTEQNLLDLLDKKPNPHEAQRYADLLMPLQVEEIKELCARLKTKPQFEAQAMFGDDVSFYRLHRHSARALAIKLRNCLET